MNSESTINSFSNYLLPFLRKTGMESSIVIMDGARCHTSKKVIDWLKKNDINI